MSFEKASRLKLRFKVSQGIIATEDLWDLSLESLDTLAKSLNKSLKEANEESFIKTRTNSNTTLQLQFDIVKHVIDVKLAERDAAKTASEKRQKKQKLMELIESKENEVLGNKSVDELRKELEALDN